MSLKVGDVVRVLPFPDNSRNAYARIEKLEGGYAVVSNLNQPFQGTLTGSKFHLSQIKKE